MEASAAEATSSRRSAWARGRSWWGEPTRMAWAPAGELAWRAPLRSCAPTWHERSSCWVAPRSRSWGRLTSRSRPIGGSIHVDEKSAPCVPPRRRGERSFLPRAGLRLAALQPESADSLRHQVPGGVARLALAEHQGATAPQHAAFRGERARRGVEEGHGQVDRDDAHSRRNGGADRGAHRHVEQGHHHAAVREAPAVGQLLAHLERHDRPAFLAVPRPGAEQIEEGDLDAEEGAAHGRGHAMQAPPSTAMYCPVTCREASEARKAMVPFRSSSPPSRPSGVAATTDFSIFSSKPRDILE